MKLYLEEPEGTWNPCKLYSMYGNTVILVNDIPVESPHVSFHEESMVVTGFVRPSNTDTSRQFTLQSFEFRTRVPRKRKKN